MRAIHILPRLLFRVDWTVYLAHKLLRMLSAVRQKKLVGLVSRRLVECVHVQVRCRRRCCFSEQDAYVGRVRSLLYLIRRSDARLWCLIHSYKGRFPIRMYSLHTQWERRAVWAFVRTAASGCSAAGHIYTYE